MAVAIDELSHQGKGGTTDRSLAVALAVVKRAEELGLVTTLIAERLPMGRLGRPEEVAACADFLLSERASYINGQIIHPNGGQQTW